MHTGHDLLTDRQRQRPTALFGVEDHVQIEATWGIYQRMIGAYRKPDRTEGKRLMAALIELVSHGVPAALTELRTLGRTLMKRADDALAHFDRPGTGNGFTEAMNGRLEYLRGSALGFRNITNYIEEEPARDRRVRAAATPSTVMSPIDTLRRLMAY